MNDVFIQRSGGSLLTVNLDPTRHYVVEKGEKEGMADLQRLAVQSSHEDGWVYVEGTDHEGRLRHLWYEVGENETAGSASVIKRAEALRDAHNRGISISRAHSFTVHIHPTTNPDGGDLSYLPSPTDYLTTHWNSIVQSYSQDVSAAGNNRVVTPSGYWTLLVSPIDSRTEHQREQHCDQVIKRAATYMAFGLYRVLSFTNFQPFPYDDIARKLSSDCMAVSYTRFATKVVKDKGSVVEGGDRLPPHEDLLEKLRSCENIATVEQLGNLPAVETLAKRKGDPRQLDTCDLQAAFPAVDLTDKEYASLFLDTGDQPYPPAVLQQRLEFLAAYPDWSTEAVMRPLLLGTDAQVTQALAHYYQQLAAAFQTFQVPVVASSVTTLLGNLLNYETIEGRSRTSLDWACGASAFPDALFEPVAHSLVRTAIDEGTYQPFLRLVDGASTLGRCEAIATPERRAILTRAKEASASSTLVDLVRRQTLTVVFVWDSNWQTDKGALLMLHRFHKQLESMGGGVVTVLPTDARITPAEIGIPEYDAPWPLIRIPRDEIAHLTQQPFRGEQLVLLMDRTGHVQWEDHGHGQDRIEQLEYALQRAVHQAAAPQP